MREPEHVLWSFLDGIWGSKMGKMFHWVGKRGSSEGGECEGGCVDGVCKWTGLVRSGQARRREKCQDT